MNIVGKIVTLRALEREDGDMLKTMLNDPAMEPLVVGWSFPVSSYAQDKWFEANYGGALHQRFAVETAEDGTLGMATLTDIDWKNGCAHHGMKLMSAKARGKGIGTDTVMALMRYAFDELRLNRLETYRFEDNIASKAMYTKCGWKVEGVKRQAVFKGGAFKDLTVAGVLASDYHALIAQNNYWGTAGV